MVAAHWKEIPMTKAKAKRKPTSRANDSKTQSRNSVRRTSARNAAPLAPVTTAAHQQARSAAQPTARRESKKAHLIAMLRAPSGATVEAMALVAKLAGVSPAMRRSSRPMSNGKTIKAVTFAPVLAPPELLDDDAQDSNAD
jgi:hypothetical protein